MELYEASNSEADCVETVNELAAHQPPVVTVSDATCQGLRLVTYNLQCGIGMDRQYNIQRVAEWLASIAPPPDIVALQVLTARCEDFAFVWRCADLSVCRRSTGTSPQSLPSKIPSW